MDINEQLLRVTETIEKQVDAAIEQIENLDVSDLEALRQKRIKEMKDKEAKLAEWKQNGHGTYDEMPEEKQFFDAIKKSERVVIHFYTDSNERCRIVDKHFKILAPKHMEALFTKLNASKCPFLAEKLKIRVIPSIISIHNGIMVDKIVGFTTLGNKDDFSTEDMEWRLAQNDFLDYDGDLSVLPSEHKHGKIAKDNGKIRNGMYNGADDDLYIEEAAAAKPAQSYELTAEEEAELGL